MSRLDEEKAYLEHLKKLKNRHGVEGKRLSRIERLIKETEAKIRNLEKIK
jgi:ferritin-like metal-binding protein YciE